MIPLPTGTKIWLVAGITDMRNGFNGLAAKVQTALKDEPMSGHVFIFRGRSGSQVKLLWSTGDGLCLLTKRLERGRFAWPSARDGKCARLSCLLNNRFPCSSTPWIWKTFFAKSIPIVLTFMIAALRSMSDDLSSHCGTRDGRRPFH
ncbi:TPA: IS66 family insertion sequence element accessory protein TnpB [Klebsiella pneumoniae]|nr:IS66 family insertion sequence element accessory protein TnpB [Klebsiella pneumoniae]